MPEFFKNHDLSFKVLIPAPQIRYFRVYKYLSTYFVIGMILVVLVMSFLMLRSPINRICMEKRMLEKDLEFRNREMTTTAVALMKNVNLIREIILSLVELKPNLKSENTPVVKEVIRKLQSLAQNGYLLG